MLNDDQRSEIDVLESIYSHNFITHKNDQLWSVSLKPFVVETPDELNHISLELHIIPGSSYPTSPLYAILICINNVGQTKLPIFTSYVLTTLDNLLGPAHNIKTTIVSGESSTENKNDFFALLNEDDCNNTDGSTSRDGETYVFDLCEALREWLCLNNTPLPKNLRDTVVGIAEIDAHAKQLFEATDDVEEKEEEEEENERDLLENVFIQEYPSTIEVEKDVMCTNEVFAKWNALFIEEAEKRRLKFLEESGQKEDKKVLSGRELWLKNLANEQFDADDSSAITIDFKKHRNDEENIDETDNNESLSTLDASVIDSIINGDEEKDTTSENANITKETTSPQNESKEVSTTPQTSSTTTQATTTTTNTTTKTEKADKSDKKSKKDGKDSKDVKDSKKSSSSKKVSSSKKDTKSDAKTELDFGSGFSDFLGNDFAELDLGGPSATAKDKSSKKSKK